MCIRHSNISGGARERRRQKPLVGSGGMLPQKILKSRGLLMLFPAFSKSYLWFTHIANSLLRTLSKQTNAHWEYNTCKVNYRIENRLPLYLETSKSFTFKSHHSKFVVINCLSCPRGKLRLHRQVVFWKLPKQLLDNILFSTFYTDLFLLFRKKTGGAVPPGPSPCYGTVLTGYLAICLSCVRFVVYIVCL